ncbi:MAG: hypothetical protein E7218_06535 [Anaerofustis stercorihominis]|nr:hypothetical protein [Anaerofustis stercorihominis]
MYTFLALFPKKGFLRAVAAAVLFVLASYFIFPMLLLIPVGAEPQEIAGAVLEVIPFANKFIGIFSDIINTVSSMTSSMLNSLGLEVEALHINIAHEYQNDHYFLFELLKLMMIAIVFAPLDKLVDTLTVKVNKGYWNKFANALFLMTVAFFATLLVNRVFAFFQQEVIQLPPLGENILLIILILIVTGGGLWASAALVGTLAAAISYFFFKVVLINIFKAVIAYYISFTVLIVTSFTPSVMIDFLLVLAMLLSWWLVLEIDNILDGRFGI